MGISDKVQAVIMLISGLLISLGASSTADPTLAKIFMIAGALGFFLKELAGTSISKAISPEPQPTPTPGQ